LDKPKIIAGIACMLPITLFGLIKLISKVTFSIGDPGALAIAVMYIIWTLFGIFGAGLTAYGILKK